jgi:spore coat polysaccharide biosynthesis protein SpsF
MQIHQRKAKLSDLDLYFVWANDSTTRSNSYNTQEVDYQEHTNWFSRKIEDRKSLLLVFENEENIPVGQIRIEHKTDENIIGISIDTEFRSLGLAVPMLTIACEAFFTNFQAKNIHAYIKKTNLASLNSFKKAGFEIINEVTISNEASYLLEKKYV